MKSVLGAILLACVLSATANAQTNENFNSRQEAALFQVKGFLQGHCWSFPDFEVNRDSWVPGIEGDGAMVSGNSGSATQNSGIITPVLNVGQSVTVSFNYKFNVALGSGVRRWIKVLLVNTDNEVVQQLDSVEFTNINTSTVYTYNEVLSVANAGNYKVYLNYQGVSGSTRIAIDALSISASLKYAGGCNEAPVAQNDNIGGAPNRQATGNLVGNDSDPNGENVTAYLIQGSPDGTVTINANNTFTFVPNPGFIGNSTSFTYQICDDGLTSLCSNIATVIITFPSGGFLPVSLIDFKGVYRDNGLVELNWTTTFEQNSSKFEVERSLDGIRWETVGSLKAQGVSTVKTNYSFNDQVSRNTANKKDLYYRLKMADLDNKTSLSRILVVRVYNTRSTKMISVSPNPAKNDINATLQLNESSVVVMKIVNSTGVEMQRKTLKLEQGINSILMEGTSRLNPGLYFLEVIINSNERMIVKLIKE